MNARHIPLKVPAITGTTLLIVGFALFLQSLGEGGGYVSVSIMVAGAIFLLCTVVMAVIRVAYSRKDRHN